MAGTAANVAYITQVDRLLHGEENKNTVRADAAYAGIEKYPKCRAESRLTDRGPGSSYRKYGKHILLYRVERWIEKAKVQMQIEYPF